MTLVPRAVPLGSDAGRTRTLLIEGWRGINHSFALVNQHQIRELLKDPDLRLFHRDLPFAFAHWSRAGNAASFPPEEQAAIDALAEPTDGAIDCVYRIGSPFRAGPPGDDRRTVTFMVTELGLSSLNFEDGRRTAAAITRGDNRIATPTRWSRDRLLDWGFPADRIEIVPHGVDARLFHPSEPAERSRSRALLGIRDDETLFLNVGLPSWNKGIDLLLVAFAALRARGRKARLILKDQRDLYGLSVQDLVARVGATCPALLDRDTLAAISTLSINVGTAELRSLYASADGYVSPYRAEGFNLPVLEAMACGTPVIVTRGGATDDFCDDVLCSQIGGRPGQHEDKDRDYVGRFIEPDLDDLVQAMDRIAQDRTARPAGFDAARIRLVERMTWREAAQRVRMLTVGRDPHPARTGDAVRAAEAVPLEVGAAAPGAGGETVTRLHQILIVDGLELPDTLPQVFAENAACLRAAHPAAAYTLWSGAMLREVIARNFDASVLAAFEMLEPYAYKSDLARLCLLHLYGGLYADLSMRFINPLTPPGRAGIAAFASPPNESPAFTSLSNGIIWSKPGRPELGIAIEAIVENCRTRFYGANCLCPTGPVCFGEAVAAARSTRGAGRSGEDQWIGQQRALTPEHEQKNWCYVTPGATLVALNVKRIAADLTHLGARGTNNYFAFWAGRRVYREA